MVHLCLMIFNSLFRIPKLFKVLSLQAGTELQYMQKRNHSRVFSLKANPNPFNPGCNITFTLAQSSDIEISLFDISGKQVHFIRNSNLTQGGIVYIGSQRILHQAHILFVYTMGKILKTQRWSF